MKPKTPRQETKPRKKAGRPKAPKRHGMTKRQAVFAAAYIKTGNAAEAARQAGYKGKHAHIAGHYFITRPQIKAYIDEQIKRIEQAEAIEIPRFVKSQLIDVATLTDVTPNKMKALELLGKLSGLFTEKVEVTGKDGAPIIYQVLPETARE